MDIVTAKLDGQLDQPLVPQPKKRSRASIVDVQHLLNSLIFCGRKEAVEPLCDICAKPITREQFHVSAATFDRAKSEWLLTHNDCESDDSIATSPFQYWIALNRIATTEGALIMSVHLMDRTYFNKSWETTMGRLFWPERIVPNKPEEA